MKPSPPYGGLPARDDISLNLGPPNWRALSRGHNGNAAPLHRLTERTGRAPMLVYTRPASERAASARESCRAHPWRMQLAAEVDNRSRRQPLYER